MCARAEKDLELKTVHKSDGEAIAAKAAAVERLQGSVRQLEETVQADKIKELTLSVRLRSLVCVNANVLSWEFPFRRSKTTRHECHSDEAVWAETVAQRLNPRRGRHVVP